MQRVNHVLKPLSRQVYFSSLLDPPRESSNIRLVQQRALVVIFIALPFYLATLSLLGTALHAKVARDKTYRIHHGLRATLAAVRRLVLGPGVVGVTGILAMIFIDNAVGRFIVPEDSLVTLVGSIPTLSLGFLPTILAVAVVDEMYRKTRPQPRVPQGPGAIDQTPA